jgi:hypothetical protein
MSIIERGPMEAVSSSSSSLPSSLFLWRCRVGEAAGVGMAVTSGKSLNSLPGIRISAVGRRDGGLEASRCIVSGGCIDAHSPPSLIKEASYVVESCRRRALTAARPAIFRREPIDDIPRRLSVPTLPNILRPVFSRPSSDDGGEGGFSFGVRGCFSNLPFRAISEIHLSWNLEMGGGMGAWYLACGFIVCNDDSCERVPTRLTLALRRNEGESGTSLGTYMMLTIWPGMSGHSAVHSRRSS